MRKTDHFRLLKGEIYTRSKQDVDITCLTGSLWITQPGTGQDIVLSPGESYWAEKGKGKLVVQALCDASLQVSGCRAHGENYQVRTVISSRPGTA
ncbi:DUF2917 domain-containing protein [Bdellovibrio sp. BCCA]|uniref:DUF2917 domain-containing protein n=1 Tax=Bdellovibrio sp. BCCA TaxID=3136281 RepID=UPI00403FD110